MRKSFNTGKILPLLLILLLAMFLRTYKLSELAEFRYDEARDAFAERQIIVEKDLTFLGPESKIGNNVIYFGPWHYYLMAPALLASSFDPIGTYYWTAILGVATVFVLYKLTGNNLTSAAFYAVFLVSVIYNRWAWNPNTIPLFASLFFLFLLRKRFFLSGIFLGFSIQLHYTSAFLIAFVIGFLLLKEAGQVRLKKFFIALTGLVLALLPMIAFDLKNEFLYLRSLANLANGGLGDRQLTFHYFFWTIPLVCLVLAKVPRKIGALFVSALLFLSLNWLLTQKVDYPVSMNRIKQVSKIIASDQKKYNSSFNVASFVDPVTSATAYRYFLALEGSVPLEQEHYDRAEKLYVITFDDRESVLYNKTYEISSFQPKQVESAWKIGEENIFRLTKEQ